MMFTKDDRAQLDRIEQALAQLQATVTHLPAMLAPAPVPVDTTEYEEPLRVDEADAVTVQRQAAKAQG